MDNSKVKKGSLLRTAFKAGQLHVTGPRGQRGRRGIAGLKGDPIKLAATSSFASRVLTADGQWHAWLSSRFTAPASTIYQQSYEADYSLFNVTGPTCASNSYQQRQLVNGVVASAPDANGYSYIPTFCGPYAAGIAVTLEYQYQQICATQTTALPAVRVLLVPFQTP